MAACTHEAKTEGEHKLGNQHTDSRLLGRLANQDRDRLIEVSQEDLRLQKGIASAVAPALN